LPLQYINVSMQASLKDMLLSTSYPKDRPTPDGLPEYVWQLRGDLCLGASVTPLSEYKTPLSFDRRLAQFVIPQTEPPIVTEYSSDFSGRPEEKW
jgi:hypothetical protein